MTPIWGTFSAGSARRFGRGLGGAAPGQQAYTSATGYFTFVVPAGVTSICAVCIGAGQAGGSANGGFGGGLAYANDISVTPGESLTIYVAPTSTGGFGGTGGDSFIMRVGSGTYMVLAKGGGSSTTQVGDVKYVGGDPSGRSSGGAAGYAGNGGIYAHAGSGGGGGGSGYEQYQDVGGDYLMSLACGGGGGTGVLGQGSNGVAGSGQGGGGGGSGGSNGSNGSYDGTYGGDGGNGGLYGGGGGGAGYNANISAGGTGGDGARGAVRIIWGAGRAYPNTNTGDV